MGAAYHTDLNVSLLRDLVLTVKEPLENVPYSPDAVQGVVEQWLRTNGGDHVSVTSQGEAESVAMAGDLRRVAGTALRPEIATQLQERTQYEDFLSSFLTKASKSLRELGLPLDEAAQMHFVDEFPRPYDSSDAAIIACDSGDKVAFGILPGLYVRQTYRPFYTEFILCHELIHLYLGGKNPDRFSGRLEEGLAEVLGAGLVALKLMDQKLVLNLFIVNRLSSRFAGQWERYLDATRQVWRVANRMGLDQLLVLTREGRPALERLEASLYQGLGSAPEPFSADVPPDLATLMSAVCDLFPRSLVASPAAFLIAPYATQGSTVREIATRAKASVELTVNALGELQDGLGLVALRPDKTVLTFSVAQAASMSGRLRYDRSLVSQ